MVDEKTKGSQAKPGTKEDRASKPEKAEDKSTEELDSSEPQTKSETSGSQAKPEKTEEETEIIEEPEEEEKIVKDELKKKTFDKAGWSPRTSLGKKVQGGEVTDVEYILDNGLKILEPDIVDALIPDIESDLLLIGQSKGKFGGGQRRVFRQTQKKTREGNKPQFATVAVVGNGNGYVGLGYGKSKETVPAREKALRKAKLNLFKVRRGCGSWQCSCSEPHSIPFVVEGKCGSVMLKLMPAPKGKGLCVESECQKILKLAGIKDVWSKVVGQTKTKINMIKACEKALRSLMSTKVSHDKLKECSIAEGKIAQEDISDKEEEDSKDGESVEKWEKKTRK